MDIETNGLPLFWQITKKDKRKCKNEEEKKRRRKANKENIKSKLNEELICPMNYLYGLKLNRFRSEDSTLPMSDFYIKHELKSNHTKAKRVEKMIEDYSLEFYKFTQDHIGVNYDESDDVLLLHSDFNKLINAIKMTGLSRNYLALMSWLINRAFRVESQGRPVDSNLEKNKSLLMNVLYTVNPKCFLACFKQKSKESQSVDL